MTKQKKSMKRLLSFILSLCMIFSCLEGLTFNVSAADPTEWTSTDSLPVDGGDYKLMTDVTITNSFMVMGSMKRVDLDLNGHTITMNDKSSYGVDRGAVLNITNGTIKNAYLWNQQSTLYLSMLTLNGANSNAVYASGAVRLEISNSTISGCKKSALSFDNSGSTKNKVKIENCTITDNQSNISGAGIYLNNTVALIKNCTITDNTAENYGAGLYIGTDTKVDIKDTVITNNKLNITDKNAGAGVYVSKDVKAGDVSIGGATEINGNKTKDGQDSNLYSDIKIRLNANMTNTQPIGIANADTVSDKLDYTKTVIYQEYSYKLSPEFFKSDVPGYTLIYNGSEKKALSLTKPFNLSVTNGIVGTSGTDTSKAVGAGDYVTIKADAAEEGKVFEHWVMTGKDLSETEKAKATVKFQMPANDVYATAEYENKLGELYEIKVLFGAADKQKAVAGETVEVTLNADELGSREVFDHWDCMQGGVTFADPKAETTTFMMPAKNVTVYVSAIPLWDVYVVDGTADKGVVKKGETITITADEAPRGKVFDKWTCETPAVQYKTVNFADETSATTTFEMPDGDVKVVANYKDDERPTYKVTVSGGMASHTTAYEGEVISISANAPEAGKLFDKWVSEPDNSVNFENANAVETTFVMPAKDVTVIAQFKEGSKPEPSPSGTDSALDPVPADLDTATELNLVKGQKFTIGKDWAPADKDSKKIVSISKKGVFKAKKEGKATIKNGDRTITVNVTKPSLEKKHTLTIVSANEVKSEKLTLTNPAELNVFWYSAAPDVATVDQEGNVTPVGKGKAKITAYINGSAYNCNVTVKEDVTAIKHTMHLAKGTKKNINVKVKGVKKLDWQSDCTEVASVKKNKVTGESAGIATLTASANEIDYKIDVFVEDLTIEATGLTSTKANKYNMEIAAGADVDLVYATTLTQDVVFKSNKPEIAFVDEDGTVHARKAGKAKFTAKVDGKTITISVTVK